MVMDKQIEFEKTYEDFLKLMDNENYQLRHDI